MSTPKVAIVILNYNGRDLLQQFLPSVLATEYTNHEVWLADNGSTDDSLDVVKAQFPNVKCIAIPENLGFAAGYNFALRQIEAPVYVLLNSDVEVPANWLGPLVDRLFSNSAVAAVQPKILMESNRESFEHAGASGGYIDLLGYPFCRGRIFMQLEKDQGQYQEAQEIFWASGAALVIKSELYHQFEGLDGDYFAHMEEIDLCWRLKRAGYQIMVEPLRAVYHVGGGTLPPSNPRKTYLNFRNSLITLLKNAPAKRLIWLIPARLVLDGLAGFRFLTEGKLKDIWAIIRAHFFCYGTIGRCVRKRRATKKLVEQHRIGPGNEEGVYSGSIVWAFFSKVIKEFR
ncbi:MAG: glycosyltransferase family 2 protein, partial [Bacteroidota bacterium]